MSVKKEQISDALQWADDWGRARNNPSREAQYIWTLRDAYKEALTALREAFVEEEQYLEIYSSELDPEHREQLRYQISQHDRILDKYPEEL